MGIEEYLSREDLLNRIETQEHMLDHYRKMYDQLERDVEFYRDSFELAKEEVENLRNEKDT